MTALRRTKSASTYELALAILWEAFKDRNRSGGKVVTLSTEVTQMPRNTKIRAAQELAEFGLIAIEQRGNQTMKAHLR
jgi:hypothetical protein